MSLGSLKIVNIGLITISLSTLFTHSAFVEAYDYPLQDPYFATVIGTPNELEYPAKGPNYSGVEKLSLFPTRKVPTVFWHGNKHRVGVDTQRGNKPTPLIFILSGTGSNFESGKTRFLRDVLYDAGFHVISLSSTTTGEFITSASSSSRPGYVPDDVADLYKIMQQAYTTVQADISVSEFYLTGFSMGAMHAAFLGELDSRQHVFDFSKIMMINPPVRLYESAQRLDQLIEKNLPDGIQNVGAFAEKIFNRYAPIFNQTGGVEIDSEFLFALQRENPVSKEELKVVLGLAFRLAASSMTFASDVMTHSGKIVRASEKLTSGDTLTGYFKQSLYWGFSDYFDQILLPYLQKRSSSMTKEQLKYALSLESIDHYLTTTTTVQAITNADDFILNEKDLDFLANTLGQRLTVYPYGGHGGNVTYHENVKQLLRFFGVRP